MAHSSLFAGGSASLEQAFWRHDAQPAALDIDLRNGVAGEGHQHRCTSARGPDLQEIAGAEIMDRDHRADRRSVTVLGGEADEIGVVPLILLARGQARVGNDRAWCR